MDQETKQMFERVLNKLDKIDKKVDNLEKIVKDVKNDQEAMKQYIYTSVEEDHKFIQKLRRVASE
ncbi:MAG: hypothetical protein N4A64_14045 [Marinisporobacter sp.]|jgi:GTP-binding protein EngB required for normal cell division|nr:hypothetical protein [Marinisporobacter sp.]